MIQAWIEGDNADTEDASPDGADDDGTSEKFKTTKTKCNENPYKFKRRLLYLQQYLYQE